MTVSTCASSGVRPVHQGGTTSQAGTFPLKGCGCGGRWEIHRRKRQLGDATALRHTTSRAAMIELGWPARWNAVCDPQTRRTSPRCADSKRPTSKKQVLTDRRLLGAASRD